MSLNQGVYIQPGTRVSMVKEQSFRAPDGTFDVAPIESYAVSTPQEGNLDMPQRAHIKERRRVIRCDGKRMVNKVVDKGYEEFTPTVPFYLNDGRHLYFGHGGCETTGTSYSPAITGSVTNVIGNIIYTNAAFGSEDGRIGDFLEVTMADSSIRRFAVRGNDASTVQTNVQPGSTIIGRPCELKTGPFFHAVTVENRVPSFAWLTKLPHDRFPDRDIDKCMLGSIQTSFDLSIDIDADIIQAVGIKGGKAVDTNPIHSYPACLDLPDFEWDHVKEFQVLYNGSIICEGGSALSGGGNVDGIGYAYENQVDHKTFAGDYFPRRIKDGLFEPTIRCHYFPFDDVFYNLIETPLSQYAGRIDIYLLLEYNSDRYFEFILDDCYLSKHPTGVPTKEDFEVGIDAEFMFDGNLLAEPEINIKDALGIEYYEDSYNG